MHDLISIGQFAQMSGLTIKALHIYAAEGLLRPAQIDPTTNYRYYYIGQLTTARRIRQLRSLEMPLDAIRDVIAAPSAHTINTLLQVQHQRIAARIEKDRLALQMLQQLMDERADDIALDIQTKQVPEQPVISIRRQCAPEDEPQLILHLLDTLQAAAAQLGPSQLQRPPVRISHTYTDELADTEIALATTQLVTGNGDVNSRMLEGGLVAYVTHIGPHDHLWASFWALLDWSHTHRYALNGPPREVYWMPPGEGHLSHYRTEIQWPIR